MADAAPTAAAGHKKRQQRLIIAGVGLAALLFLYLRSRSGNTPALAAPAVAPTDPNASAGLPAGGSTFADNGAQASSLLDGLSGVQAALQDQTAALQQAQQAGSTGSAGTGGGSSGGGGGGSFGDTSGGDTSGGDTGATSPGLPSGPSYTINNNIGVPGPPPAGQPHVSPKTTPKPLPYEVVGAKKPANPAGGGHYTPVAGGFQLIHAVGPGKWAPGPPPKPPLKPKTPNANKKKK